MQLWSIIILFLSPSHSLSCIFLRIIEKEEWWKFCNIPTIFLCDREMLSAITFTADRRTIICGLISSFDSQLRFSYTLSKCCGLRIVMWTRTHDLHLHLLFINAVRHSSFLADNIFRIFLCNLIIIVRHSIWDLWDCGYKKYYTSIILPASAIHKFNVLWTHLCALFFSHFFVLLFSHICSTIYLRCLIISPSAIVTDSNEKFLRNSRAFGK